MDDQDSQSDIDKYVGINSECGNKLPTDTRPSLLHNFSSQRENEIDEHE
jgi:hypothetical protein